MTTAADRIAAQRGSSPGSPPGAPLPELPAAEVAAWQARGGPLVELLTRAAELGPLAAFTLGERRTVLVTGAEQVQHVLAQHPDGYVKQSHRAGLLLGAGVISASGEAWKQQRRLLQSQFTSVGLRQWEQRITEAAQRTERHWAALAAAGRPTDIDADMQFFALDTIWRTLTGDPLDEETRAELDAVNLVVATLSALTATAPADQAEVTAALARIDAACARAIDTARARLAASEAGAPGEADPTPGGLLRLLLEAARTKPEYTDRLIRDELVNLLVAGHETTAKTLTWLFLRLARHPEVRERALAVCRTGSPEQRQEMVHALINETLRLHPAVWLIPRYAAAEDTVGGYRIEAGSHVLSCPYLTHRRAELWPEPEQFDPWRFIEPGRRPARLGAFYPFGLGARACLGQQFSYREMAALLELLLTAYDLDFQELPQDTFYGVVMHPVGRLRAAIRPL
ncbi:cytochrome P450 [Kitasatospora sp. MMS16-BH015]|uniref:cytochrome P450 n=1 Tax=Kitasatospora sp. MMS16-BH015 TaxID=2018025 RepID=UPI000CA3DDC6|nr:cytochrome P450 [Kitasatospora sp. MMS16-BH015]AUG80713.1 cytochrome P450 [Kitasatospora sp. MMS16-BH015]